jgi:hypothetical protein
MSDNSIFNIIDKNLRVWIDKGLNSAPIKIEPEMANPNEPMDNEGWQKWYPIESTITDSELEGLEAQLTFKLPVSYKAFLKYKHFYDLYIYEAHFSGQEIRNWRRHLLDMAFDGYPQEFLIDKGYIPFADWSDWGLLCFDTNKPTEGNEYPIVLWDHERCDEFEEYSKSFEILLSKLDKLSDTNGR